MAEFTPDPPPLVLPAAPDVLSPNIPLNPPMVGTASPFIHVDGQNRDLILESIRTWVRVSLLPWTTNWQTQLTDWETDAAEQLNAWMTLADAYVTEHAIAGLSFRTTETPIASEGTTDVTLTVDTNLRPLTIDDLVLDQSADGNYGIITAVLTDTTATVEFVGSLRGPTGYSVRTTATPIAGEGTTNVVLAADALHPFQVGDIILDTSSDSNFGITTVIIDATHVTVSFLGTLKGNPGSPGAPGDPGAPGADGIMASIVAGANITVDATDPANPIVSTTHGIFIYTDPTVMNNALTGGSPPASGSVGVLSTGVLETSIWTVVGGTWQCHSLILSSTDVETWRTIITTLNLGVNTLLNLNGASATEDVNGSHPTWQERIGEFVQDLPAFRSIAGVGIDAAGIISTPAGSADGQTDNSVFLTECTRIILLNVLPDWAHDDTDVWQLRIWGKLDSNGEVDLQFVNIAADEPDSEATHYASFGSTSQYNAGAFTHDDDFVDGIGVFGGWKLAVDTTGSPEYLDVVITGRHFSAGPTNPDSPLGLGQPIIADMVSNFYDTPIDPPRLGVMFNRTGTMYYYGNDDNRRGVVITFAQPFTGTITNKAI